MDSYMAVTAHFIDKSTWSRKSVVRECLPFPEKHSAENISKAIDRSINNYNLNGKVYLVVRDNAANVVKAMDVSGLNHVGCFLHALHLIISNSMKRSAEDNNEDSFVIEKVFVSFNNFICKTVRFVLKLLRL